MALIISHPLYRTIIRRKLPQQLLRNHLKVKVYNQDQPLSQSHLQNVKTKDEIEEHLETKMFVTAEMTPVLMAQARPI